MISFCRVHFFGVSTYFLSLTTGSAVGRHLAVKHPHLNHNLQKLYLVHTTSLRNMSLHSSPPAKKSTARRHATLGDDKPLEFVRRGSLDPADLYAPMYQASSDPASAASGAYTLAHSFFCV